MTQSDAGTHTISTAKAWEVETFNDTFTAAPVVIVTHNAGSVAIVSVKSRSTTGFDIYSTATGNHGWIARESGFDSTGNDSDAGVHSLTNADTWEAVTFNDTFASVPAVVVVMDGVGTAGESATVKDVTTTGFSVMGDVLGDICWIATEKAFG